MIFKNNKKASSFAASLVYTNGLCPYCKEQIYPIKDGMILADLDAGRKHYPKHRNEYDRASDILDTIT